MNDHSDLKAIAEACQQHQPLRFMRSHGALYIRNDNGIVFDVHQNRSFPEFMAQNKDYADLVLAANPATILALIAENERMAEFAAHMVQLRETHGFDSWAAVLVEVDRLKAENEALRKDAGRWRAFINCARIKFFGWAGYGEKDPYGNSPGDYRHFGGEFWTIHDAPTADKEKAAEILNGFADAAIAAKGKELVQ